MSTAHAPSAHESILSSVVPLVLYVVDVRLGYITVFSSLWKLVVCFMDPLEHFTRAHCPDGTEDVPGNLIQGVAPVDVHDVGPQPGSVSQATGQAVLAPGGHLHDGVTPAAPSSAASTGRDLGGGTATSLGVLVQLLEGQLLATKALMDRLAPTG